MVRRISIVAVLATFASAAVLTSAGCSAGGSGGAPPSGGAPGSVVQPLGSGKSQETIGVYPGTKIRHVIVMIQENHSFDNLFQGYPGANTQSYGYDSNGDMVPLQQVELGSGVDLGHLYQDFVWNYDNGKMDGFDKNTRKGGAKKYAYTYIDPTNIGPYLQMAGQYVLADNYFTSHLDASFTGHQMLIAAEADHAVDLPSSGWGCSGGPSDSVNTISGTAQNRILGPPESPCFGNPSDPMSYQTLGDLVDANHLTWRWYAPKKGDTGYYWMAYQAVSHVYNGPDWANYHSPETQIITDIANGQLASVTWVTPTFANSDHGGSNSKTGPSWIASVVNAVGESQFWDSTAIFITWDEWGGLYDHVPPPQLYYDGLGMRVPLLCISPYAMQGVVNHTQLEAASVVRFIEDNFSLGRLTAPDGSSVRDAAATSAATGCLNLSQQPRAFVPITSSYSKSYFLHEHAGPPTSAGGDADGD